MKKLLLILLAFIAVFTFLQTRDNVGALETSPMETPAPVETVTVEIPQEIVHN